jgi:hypothetical protein
VDKYTKSNKRTFIIILLSIIVLPSGYFGIFYYQIVNGDVNKLKNKYSVKNRKKYCNWSQDKTYLDCMRKDFYLLLRTTGPYASQLAFQFESDVFRYDRDLQTTDIGKVNSYLDHLDLGLNFLLIEKEYRLSRKRMNIQGILFAKLNRKDVLNEISHFDKYLGQVKNNYNSTLISNPLLFSKFNRLEKEYAMLKPQLKIVLK